MKKAIIVLLVISLLFVCGCDKGNSSSQGTEAFEISEAKFIPADQWNGKGKYILDFKFTCLYPEKSGEDYPQTFNLHYTFLDEEGMMIKEDYLQMQNLFYGDMAWASSFDLSHLKDKQFTPEDINKIASVKFTGYDAWGTKIEQLRFNHPIVLKLTKEISSSVPVTESPTSLNSIFKLKAICADDSYRDEDNSPLRTVYLFYTITAEDENLEIDSKGTRLTINGKNEYTSSSSLAAKKWIKNYYNSSYIENVYIGSSLDVMTVFKIPEGDLNSGKTITLKDSQIPGVEHVSLSTDDIIHFNSLEEIAADVDLDGYTEMCKLREDADTELTQRVREAVTNRYYTCYVNNIWYRVEFHPGDQFKVITEFSKLADNSGSYSVKKGYIFCTNGLGYVIEIPYHFQDDGLIWLDTDEAFDVN